MTDIVQRLRHLQSVELLPVEYRLVVNRAAAEIKKLREESQHRLEMLLRQKAEIERLKARLDPLKMNTLR